MIANIELPLDGMTWADLREFVAYAQNEADTEEVTYSVDGRDGHVTALLIIAVDIPPKDA